MKTISSFLKGKMNKSDDERILAEGEYIDALNLRTGSSTVSEVGSLEKAKGNTKLTDVNFLGTTLSGSAVCIGSYADPIDNNIYWFINDPNNGDLIVSYNVVSENLIYHVVSVSVLNFNKTYHITGVNLIGDLLFWTDNYNPPRKINVKKTYGLPTGGVDTIVEDDLSVIVKPPKEKPTIILTNTPPLEEGFLFDNFLCFAYRYKYIDGEYSALSQFTSPTFLPKSDFDFDFSKSLNNAMQNKFNSITIGFNTGDKRVTDIDLCFKDSSNDVIKVIDTYNKKDNGWSNNITQNVFFKDKKIKTILSSAEILRVFDNVPKLAKAQTFQDNRLMYGNYVDGYDIKDAAGNKTPLDYVSEIYEPNQVDPLTNQALSSTIVGTINDSTYTLSNTSPAAATITGSQATFDFTGVEFVSGTEIAFNFSIYAGVQSEVVNDNPAVLNLDVTRTDPIIIRSGFLIVLNDSYANAYSFFNSDEFKRALGIGAASTPPTYFNPFSTASAASPLTATDLINNAITLNPATNTVTSSAATPVNSAAPDASVAVFNPAPPSYPTGQTGFNITTFAPPSNDSNLLTIQLPLPVYYSTPGSAGGSYSYEGIRFWSAAPPSFNVNPTGDKKSLHSNRDYDIGIIYMDEYNRSTTPLLSLNSSFNVPVSSSILINKARTTIPPSMNAPFWAKRYKFAIKPSALTYDTIYSSQVFEDQNDSSYYWCYLEGEQAAKVTVGQLLIPKRDSVSALSSYEEISVLEKSVTPNIDSSLNPPAGAYMKIKETPGFVPVVNNVRVEVLGEEDLSGNIGESFANLVVDLNAVTGATPFSSGAIPRGTIVTLDILFYRDRNSGLFASCDFIGYQRLQMSRAANQDYNTSTGSAVNDLRTNLAAFIQNQFVDSSDNFPAGNVSLGPNTEPIYPIKFTNTAITDGDGTEPNGDYHEISLNSTNGPVPTGGPGLGFRSRFRACFAMPLGSSGADGNAPSQIRANITFNSQLSVPLVFETEALDSNPDFFFEGEESYEIINNKHQGNFQNQFDWSFADNGQNNAYRTAVGLPASPNGYGNNVVFTDNSIFGGSNTPHSYTVGDTVIINQNLPFTHTAYQGEHTVVEVPDVYTICIELAFAGSTPVQPGTANSPAIIINDFYNCFSFGNGVESINILDSVKKPNFTIGNRIYAISDQEYKETRRGSSITYSGLFSLEGNINRLNSFNLGSLNFKDLDNRYGDIQILDGRKSDLLSLQENKISYVLSGKTQLLNADGSANISASTNVLGTQIARVEEYGISRNPESYVQYGIGKYFTDGARGAVIELRGDAYSNEQLQVVSEFGLRSWFRDLFVDYPDTQKVGAYDPFIDEYVLSSNQVKLPQEALLYNCGNILTFTNQKDTVNYTVDYGTGVDVGELDYNITSGEINLSLNYGGVSVTTGNVTGSGTLNFNKNKSSVENASVEVQIVNGSVTPASFTLENKCLTPEQLTVVLVCVYDPDDAGKQITNEFSWSNQEPFNSPLYSKTILFDTDVIPGKTAGNYVAQYELISGGQGEGMIPTSGLPASLGSLSSLVNIKSVKSNSDTYNFDSANNRLMYFWSNILYQNNPSNINALLTAANNITTVSPTSTGVYSGSFDFNPSAPPPALNYLYIIYDYFS